MNKFELLDTLNPDISVLNDINTFAKYLRDNRDKIESYVLIKEKDKIESYYETGDMSILTIPNPKAEGPCGYIEIPIQYCDDGERKTKIEYWDKNRQDGIVFYSYDIYEIRNYKRTKLIDKILL